MTLRLDQMRHIKLFVKSEVRVFTKNAAAVLMGCGFLALVILLLRFSG
ncbi:MAG: hypothetical protein ACK5P7_08180 [Bdellovibrio sp.]